MLRTAISALCIVSALSCEIDRSPPAEGVVRIVTLGDSITEGVREGVKAEETFSSLIEADLRKKGIAAEVINEGVASERTDQAQLRLQKDVIARQPVVVTIMYGTNDSFVDEGQSQSRLSLDKYQALLGAMIDALQKAGIRPVLMTEPRWGPRARNGLRENPNPRLEKYVEACRRLAEERGLPLVDHFADWTRAEARGIDTSAWTVDQLHPTPEGHRRMAELMLPVLLKELGGS